MAASEMTATKPTIDKVVLAYSGGLDTSVIIKWLADRYGYDVIAFIADHAGTPELRKHLARGPQPIGIAAERFFAAGTKLEKEALRDSPRKGTHRTK